MFPRFIAHSNFSSKGKLLGPFFPKMNILWSVLIAEPTLGLPVQSLPGGGLGTGRPKDDSCFLIAELTIRRQTRNVLFFEI